MLVYPDDVRWGTLSIGHLHKIKTAGIGNSKNLKTVTPEASLLWAHIILKRIVQQLQQIQSAILTYSATFKTTT